MRLLAIVLALSGVLPAQSLDSAGLEKQFQEIARDFDGRVGVCALHKSGRACFNGEAPFSLQSTMKLVLAMAVMDAVEHRGWRLDQEAVLTRKDLALFVQPIADRVNAEGSVKTTLDDLMRRAIIDSDSAATDFLMARLGGPAKVQAFLKSRGVKGVRVDRDERHLQTEIFGTTWRPEFVDANLLDKTLNAIPERTRDAAMRKYQTDSRDTATPAGMATLLRRLADHSLLSASSSDHLIDVMKQTVTFPDRLKAGTAPGWTIAHKTGTSNTWKGVTVATNDIGLLISPNGESIAIAAFVADSKRSSEERGALIAKLAAATIANFR